MEATRIERIKRLAKKQAGLFDELQLNLEDLQAAMEED